MTDNPGSAEFGSYAALIRRRRVWIFTILPAVLLVSVYLAYALPAQYRSTATIILEEGSIPDELIKSTVNSPAEQQLEIIQGRALTVEALQKVVQDVNPYPDHPEWTAEQSAQQIIASTALERVDPVTLTPLEKSPAFSLHYLNPNPARAAAVTSHLADLFLTYHQRQRIEAAKAGAKLLENRATELGKELQDVDDQYAKLASQYGGVLPEAGNRNEDVRYRAARDLDDQERQLRAAREQESLLSIQLSATSPNLMTGKGGDLTDVATVRAQLAEAELRYTPDHPDVKRLRRALANMMGQSQAASGGPANADNPEYRRISSRLAASRSEVAALQESVARARGQLQMYTANLNPSAEVSRKVLDLERRRASLQTQFQEVQAKLRSAQLGQVVEADDQHAEHFSMIREPFPASSPYSPNRIGIILIGLVLGGALAAGAVAIAESTDVTVRGARDVLGFGTIPVLGTVSEILLPEDIRRRKLFWGAIGAAYVLATMLVVATVIRAEIRDSDIQATVASI